MNTNTILVYDAHVMTYFIFIFYFICMNKVETLMYELMYECMMKVPLFAIFFSFQKKMNDVSLILYESMHGACPLVFFSLFTLYETYFN